MAVTLRVPISTAVVEQNSACVVKAEFENDSAVIYLDLRRQHHHEILDIGRRTRLHWSKEPRTFEAQELSAFPWPIRYHVTTADAWYYDAEDRRVHYSPPILGLDSHAKVSDAVKRAAVLLVVIGAIGYRRVAWLLQQLFRVTTSKSSLARWVKEVAATLPSREEIVERLNQDKPITEVHFDEIFPKGKAGPGCVLVVKDEHSRIIASQRIEHRDEEHVVVFLQWLHGLGLKIRTFYIDTCSTYRKTIPQVFKDARIQLDYFHIIQNVWRHLWKFFVSRRRAIASRAENSKTPWYKARMKALARSLWENRHILFKGERKLTPEDRTKLTEICEADGKIRGIRAFLSGVWNIFENSKDQEEAKKALEELKRQESAMDSKHHKKALDFLEDTLEQATTYLREEDVQRNSLAECGMRILRRLEQEHDGFRTDDSREDFLKIYQAVKYLGWSVHGELKGLKRTSP